MSQLTKELKWIDSIYENCENVGISKQIIERFATYYLEKGVVKDA